MLFTCDLQGRRRDSGHATTPANALACTLHTHGQNIPSGIPPYSDFVLDLLILIVICCCPTLINISWIRCASPVYIECGDFLGISMYMLTNSSLIDRTGRVYIEGVDFLSNHTYTEHDCHLELFVWESILNYIQALEWKFTIYLRLQRVGPTESMQVRVAYRMPLRYLSQNPTSHWLASLALQSKPQTANLWTSRKERSVSEAAKNRNRMALYMVAGTAPYSQNQHLPYGNPTETLREPYGTAGFQAPNVTASIPTCYGG